MHIAAGSFNLVTDLFNFTFLCSHSLLFPIVNKV
jgi:hypothetical protein